MKDNAVSGKMGEGSMLGFGGAVSMASAIPERRRSLVAWAGDFTISLTIKAASFFPFSLSETWDACTSFSTSFCWRRVEVDRFWERFVKSSNCLFGRPRFDGRISGGAEREVEEEGADEAWLKEEEEEAVEEEGLSEAGEAEE